MFVHTPCQISEVFKMNTLELDKDEYDEKAARTLIGTHLDCPFGEALSLETPWDLTFNTHSVEGNCHLLEGKAIYFELKDLIISSKIENIYEAFNTQSDNPTVSSKVLETDSDEYWDKIIVYLMSLNVPDAFKGARKHSLF